VLFRSYVNGGLFDSKLNKVPHTTDALREALINCCTYDWSDISPVIFGSLFQAVMDNVERRSLGAHYTSEKNILRVLKPLFLDELQNEFENLKSSDTALENFRKKINGLTFLDPACGCGNFLVVAYRELRLLDIEFIRKNTEYIDALKSKQNMEMVSKLKQNLTLFEQTENFLISYENKLNTKYQIQKKSEILEKSDFDHMMYIIGKNNIFLL
jgi:type II restriction/modification system DNA methylase subunit YeeA